MREDAEEEEVVDGVAVVVKEAEEEEPEKRKEVALEEADPFVEGWSLFFSFFC